jgi:hypothetical protein
MDQFSTPTLSPELARAEVRNALRALERFLNEGRRLRHIPLDISFKCPLGSGVALDSNHDVTITPEVVAEWKSRPVTIVEVVRELDGKQYSERIEFYIRTSDGSFVAYAELGVQSRQLFVLACTLDYAEKTRLSGSELDVLLESLAYRLLSPTEFSV